MAKCQDPTLEEMTAYLQQGEYETDEGEIAEAIYWFANDWHLGSTSNLYEALCICPYQPGPICEGMEPGTMAELLYDALKAEYIG